MWELIQINKRNSVLLLAAMGMVLIAVGFIIGASFWGIKAGWIGILIASGVWLVMMLISISSGDAILLASSKAVPVTHDVHPQLFNIVEEMKIAAGLPKMPKIYIINDPAPNAFATGRNPENASVAVTAGLLARLNRDELQGVIAHEVSHIVHRDILFVTLAGIMLGTIVLISQVFLRGMFYSSLMGGRRYSSRSSGGGGGQLVMLILAIVLAILAPLLAQILYFALSRRREYLADAGAVRLTRYPEGLARALEKISGSKDDMKAANKVTAPMYIANPFRGKKSVNLYSTHPPIEGRIRNLRNMSHGAALTDYEKSYESVTHKAGMVPRSGLTEEAVAIRPPSSDKGPVSKSKQNRQMGDLMRKVNGFQFLTCRCGIKMKIPPNFSAGQVQCPRCGRVNKLRS